MSNRNDETTAFAIVGALIMTTILVMIVVAYVIALCLSAIMTFISLLAWNKPRRIFGEILTPFEARFFVGAGVLGAVGLPFFAGVCSTLLEVHVPDEYWIHIVLAGYAFGSIGLTMFAVNEGVFDSPPHEAAAPPIDAEDHDLPGPEFWNLPASPPHFRYATWDDEEAGR